MIERHLVVDDEIIRKDRLIELGLPQLHIWTESVERAMLYLRISTHIWLDHDLENHETTMIVVQTFAELLFHEAIELADVPHFFIHTMNPVGRESLKVVCNRWGFSHSDIWL